MSDLHRFAKENLIYMEILKPASIPEEMNQSSRELTSR